MPAPTFKTPCSRPSPFRSSSRAGLLERHLSWRNAVAALFCAFAAGCGNGGVRDTQSSEKEQLAVPVSEQEADFMKPRTLGQATESPR
jgi:hypothetical protein